MNKLQNIFVFQRGTWKVNPDSLHYRIYQWWLANTDSKKTPLWGYRENFCHYWRVVLLWSPLLWFFVVPIFHYGRLSWRFGWIRRWMVVAGLTVVAAIVYAVLFSPQLLSTFTVLGVFVLVSVAILGSAYGMYRISNARTTERIIVWFFTKRKWVVVSPWSVTLVTLVVLSLLTLGVKTTGELLLNILIGLGLGVGFVLAAFAVFGTGYAAMWSVKRVKRLLTPSARRAPVHPTYSRSAAHPREKGMSTVGVAARALWAQHNRICPLVELPGQVETESQW